jgi:hypothetical protein
MIGGLPANGSTAKMILMATSEFIAPAESLLGQLQRGRGEGYRQALNAPKIESHSVLLECITHDPRLDSQVESRDEYYACIAVDTDFPLKPLADHLRLHDDQSQGSSSTTLAVTTLTELAKRNYKEARNILCNYIGWGQWWNWPLNDLTNISDEDLSRRIASAIEQHFPSEDALDEAMQSWPTRSFTQLSEFSSRIQTSTGKALAKISSASRMNLGDLTALSPKEILDLVGKDNYRQLDKRMANVVRPNDTGMLMEHLSLDKPFSTFVALAGLAKLAPPSAFSRLTELWAMIPEKSDPAKPESNLCRVVLRQGLSRAILALPADVTSPLARTWFFDQDSRKHDLAEKLLQSHATQDDIPILREALRQMLADEEAEWRCFLIKAFFHLPDIGIIPELVDIFYRFRFSTGRGYAAEAIQVTSPDYFRDTLALECLWDCEEGTRALGAKFVSVESDQARKRLRHLANDAFESNEVLSESKVRLSAYPPAGVK